jgi:hypothetical protein
MNPQVPANLTSREELLNRDVKILLEEVTRLRKEKEELEQIVNAVKLLVRV